MMTEECDKIDHNSITNELFQPPIDISPIIDINFDNSQNSISKPISDNSFESFFMVENPEVENGACNSNLSTDQEPNLHKLEDQRSNNEDKKLDESNNSKIDPYIKLDNAFERAEVSTKENQNSSHIANYVNDHKKNTSISEELNIDNFKIPNEIENAVNKTKNPESASNIEGDILTPEKNQVNNEENRTNKSDISNENKDDVSSTGNLELHNNHSGDINKSEKLQNAQPRSELLQAPNLEISETKNDALSLDIRNSSNVNENKSILATYPDTHANDEGAKKIKYDKSEINSGQQKISSAVDNMTPQFEEHQNNHSNNEDNNQNPENKHDIISHSLKNQLSDEENRTHKSDISNENKDDVSSTGNLEPLNNQSGDLNKLEKLQNAQPRSELLQAPNLEMSETKNDALSLDIQNSSNVNENKSILVTYPDSHANDEDAKKIKYENSEINSGQQKISSAVDNMTPQFEEHQNNQSNNEDNNPSPLDIPKERGDFSLPLGLSNPQAYCYLNSILQIFFTCAPFRGHMINFYQDRANQDTSDSDLKFVCELGELLFRMLKKDAASVQDTLTRFHKQFENSIYGDDIHKCYLQILTKVNKVLKRGTGTIPQPNVMEKRINDADLKFMQYRSLNPGFVFELFSGQISFETKCERCTTIHSQKFQLFKSMPLQVPVSNYEIEIEKCIENFFLKSEIIDGEYKCCESPNIFFVSQFTHVPKYLLIYLVRGAYNSYEMKKNTFITFDRHIVMPTINGNVFYKVQSVVDHLGGNQSGHYFVKSCSSTWWLKNDFQVKQISWSGVVTKHSIGVFLELETDDDNKFYQPPIPAFKSEVLSTLQMLYSCTTVRKNLVEYYSSFDYKSQINKNAKFIKNLGELFYCMEEKKIERARNLLGTLQDYIHATPIRMCFIEILTRLQMADNIITDNTESSIKNADQRNNELDFFSIIILETYICINCGDVTNNQKISQYLELNECKEIHLLAAIEKYFRNTAEVYFKKKCQNCNNNRFTWIRELKRVPRYLFFDLHCSNKSENLIDFDDGVMFPFMSGHVSYTLIAVLLLSEKHYYTRYLDKDWMDSEELEPKTMSKLSFNKNHVVGLMMKCKDKNDDFRTSKDYETMSNVEFNNFNREEQVVSSALDKECGDNSQTADTHLNEFGKDKTEPILVNENGLSFNTQLPNTPTVNMTTEITKNETKFTNEDEMANENEECEYLRSLVEMFYAINSSNSRHPLSVILSMLYTCVSFREHIIEYHKSDRIGQIDLSSRNDINESDLLFVNDFCSLFIAVNKNDLTRIKELIAKIETYSSIEFDLIKCYDVIINSINLITKEAPVKETDLTNRSIIERFRSPKSGFIYDLFVGLLSITIICDSCNTIQCHEYRTINKLSINVKECKKFDNLEECVKSCYMNFEHHNNKKYCCCRNEKIKTIRKFIHAPKYLFIYLDRTNQRNIVDKFSEIMVLEKSDGSSVKYSICAVIDLSANDIYSLSTYLPVTKCWKKFTFSYNFSATDVKNEELINKFNIGFLLKKTN